MKTKVLIIILLTLFFITGCEDNISKTSKQSQPEWVGKILSQTINDNSLEGSWSYSSVVSYENADCIGEGETYDYSGIVTYGESDAVRTESFLLLFSDFQQKGYSEEKFHDMCIKKNGTINSNGNCEGTYDMPFEYYLTEDGYCETYIYAPDKSKTWCGTIELVENTATITYSYDSDYAGKSHCKIVEMEKQ